MKRNFNLDSLEINFSRLRNDRDEIVMSISSDYSDSSRKSALYVNEKPLANDIERLWKQIKTKKLLSLSVCFGTIDWYTDETNQYNVPNFNIKRGLKKVRIGEDDHWSIPKDWSFDMTFLFADTTAITPLLEVVKATLGSKFSEKAEKEFRKVVKPLLQKKSMYANFYSEEEEVRQRSYW